MRIVIRLFFKLLRRILMPFMLIYAELSKPKPIQRDASEQAKVDEQCRELTLYQYSTCPFCIKVKKEIHRLALPIELANVLKDQQARSELEQQGGKVQVPCLKIVAENGTTQWLYESDAIKHYLQQRFAA
ncbi:glutathione S-transferase N-terminal domain-containing protein [Shewanella sp. A3A]|nr:glutathione S-transferase N-terminal domain-containing protein [Shewanella ferrihydritica]